MNRSTFSASRLVALTRRAPQANAAAVCLALSFAGYAEAQQAQGSLTTRATVTGQIDQSSSSSGQQENQRVLVGSALQLPARPFGNAASLSANGTLTRNVSQTLQGAQSFAVGQISEQQLNVGSLVGSLQLLGNTSATGLVDVAVSQSSDTGTAGETRAGQRIDVGVVRATNDTASGAAATVSGVVSAGGITQSNQGNIEQTLEVGAMVGQLTGNAQVTGSLAAKVTQQQLSSGAPAGAGAQQVRIAAASNSGATLLQLQGTQLGAITQTLIGQGQRQSVRVATADGFFGISARAVATVQAAVTQTNEGQTSQNVEVASIIGGSAQSIDIQATLSGAGISQAAGPGTAGGSDQTVELGVVRDARAGLQATVRADASGAISQLVTQTRSELAQRIQLGSITASGGTASAQASVTGSLSQSRQRQSSEVQTIAVGAISGSTGLVSTNAIVTGSIDQLSRAENGNTQTVTVGSTAGTGAASASTQALLAGRVSQSTSNASADRQQVHIGSVVRN